jgi:hypothetical protein
MQVFVTRGGLRKSAVNAVLAATCAAGLMVCATLNAAEAKGGYVRATTTGAATPIASSVRDHRGQPQTLPPSRNKAFACKQGKCHRTTDERLRDHRTR